MKPIDILANAKKRIVYNGGKELFAKNLSFPDEILVTKSNAVFSSSVNLIHLQLWSRG